MEPQKDYSLVKAVGKFSFATLISRILGYIRDASVAHFFGGGLLTDAFYTAFRISNLLRRLVGEGSFSSSFVPVFSKSLKTESREETQNFLSSLFTTLFFSLIILTSAGMILAPQITYIIAPGFRSDPEKFALTVQLTRWMFPFFFFICLAALLTAVLNCLRHFFLPALSPSSLSIAEIAYLFLLLRHFSPGVQIAGLAVSVVAGGLIHFSVQLPTLFKENFFLKFRAQWKHPHTLQVAKLMLPAMIGLSVDQINSFVDSICASFLIEGSVTALYNSNRLVQLPLALFGIAVASVSLPLMSEQTAEKNFEKLSGTINESLRLVIFTAMPATFGLIFLAHPIISLLFEHGQFTSSATHLTVRALYGYTLGLIAFSSAKILVNAFYSLQEPGVPVKIGASCMLLNIVLNLLLMRPLGVGGLALATAISSWVNALTLFFMLRKRLQKNCGIPMESIQGQKISQTLTKSLCATFGMILFLLWVTSVSSRLTVPFQVLIGVVGGLSIYLILSKILKMPEQKSIWSMIGIDQSFED